MGGGANVALQPAVATLLGGSIGAVVAATLAYVYGIRNAGRQRKLERDNVTRALLTEVHALNSVLTLRLNWWTTKVDPAKWIPPLVEVAVDAYDKLGGNIGQLESALAQDIVRFYGYIRFINEFQKTRDEYLKNNRAAEFYAAYTSILTDHLSKRGDSSFQEWCQRYSI